MQQVIQQLETVMEEYIEKVLSFSEAEFSNKPLPHKWSKKEIIGHLTDSAQNNIQRFIRAQYQLEPNIIYNQDEWVTLQDYQHYPSADLINLWQLLNKHICIVLKTMSPEMYDRLCNTGKEANELHTIQFLAIDYVAHHLHHLKQIV